MQDVIDGKLDATIGIDTAIVNAVKVYAAYEERSMACRGSRHKPSGNRIRQSGGFGCGCVVCREAGRVAAEAEPGSERGAVAMDEARRADEAQTLHSASELEKAAIAEGTKTQRPQPRRRQKRLNRHPRPHRGWWAAMALPGHCCENSGKLGSASQNAYEQAISAARAAGPARKKPRRRRLKLRPLLVGCI